MSETIKNYIWGFIFQKCKNFSKNLVFPNDWSKGTFTTDLFDNRESCCFNQ